MLCCQLLEVQQQLAVAVSADRRKDIMIDQLDKVRFRASMVGNTELAVTFVYRNGIKKAINVFEIG